MKLFVGMDVSLGKSALGVLSEHGDVLKEAEVASDPEALARWIEEESGSIPAVGLEAGPLSQRLHRGLSAIVLDVVLMETRQVKGALRAMPIKTDQRDAEASHVCFTSGGSVRSIASLSRRKRSAHCCRRARRSSWA